MYRHCIYCSGDLGANDALEAFPIGRTLAFDAAKGRLWAVCGKCARWNLAPFEERWEPVEAAERLFRDARLRVQSENVGLAKLPDGTRLIRVGTAPRRELAAWRYGDELKRRRHRYALTAGWSAAAHLVGWVGFSLGVVSAAPVAAAYWLGGELWESLQNNRPLHTLPASETPDGKPLVLRRRALDDAVLRPASGGGVELYVPAAVMAPSPKWDGILVESPIVIPDRTARRVLERGMVHVNAAGADYGDLTQALDQIGSAGSAEDFIRSTAALRTALRTADVAKPKMPEVTALALEIALHEEQERRAMEGELAVLEAAWRDAEPIASIADRLALE
jgi:hypothetical protein